MSFKLMAMEVLKKKMEMERIGGGQNFAGEKGKKCWLVC